MDDLIENHPGVRLVEIFDGPVKLPRPDQLGDDAEAESALKTLLATFFGLVALRLYVWFASDDDPSSGSLPRQADRIGLVGKRREFLH